jgi:hypothetical protein
MYKHAKDKTWLKRVMRKNSAEYSVKRRRIIAVAMKSTNVGAVIVRRKSRDPNNESNNL